MLTELASLDIVCMAIVMDKQALDPARQWRSDRRRFYNEMMAFLLADCLHLHDTTRIIVSHKNYESYANLQLLVMDIGDHFRHVLKRTASPTSEPCRPPTMGARRRVPKCPIPTDAAARSCLPRVPNTPCSAFVREYATPPVIGDC
jgi:hypothetical protein